MPTEEEERQEDYVLRIAAILLLLESRIQKRIDPVLRRQLKEARDLVEQMGEEGVFRQFEWQQLSRQAPAVFEPLAEELKDALAEGLPEVQQETAKRAAAYVNQPEPDLPATGTDSLLRAVVMGIGTAASLGALLDRPGGAHSRFARNLAKQLNKTVQAGLISDEPTSKIANHVAPQTTVKGAKATAIKGGTFANGARQRVKNAVAGAVWATSADTEAKVWRPYAVRWQWLATLENTCPVCLPLHKQIRDKRSDFPYFAGHVHYNCRCKLVPVAADPTDT